MTNETTKKQDPYFPFWVLAPAWAAIMSLVIAFVWSTISTILNGSLTVVHDVGAQHRTVRAYHHHYAVPSDNVYLILAIGIAVGLFFAWFIKYAKTDPVDG